VIRLSGNIPHGRLDSAGLLRPRGRAPASESGDHPPTKTILKSTSV
jgi:hypothetical protein